MALKNEKKITRIEAKTVQAINGLPVGARKRVAAYCRVSTVQEEQEASFESQVSFYTKQITSRADWTLVDIYADEGISGTNTKKRTDFLRMIEACMAGKIDMIITKSVSRFARNTEDCLHYVRQLKEKGISVYFETENIDTLGSTGELLLTILSGLAQDSSRNQSDVTKWGILRQFEAGNVRVNTARFLGYDRNKEGDLIIKEEQAKQVRRIFSEYLEGKSHNEIAKGFMKDGIKTVTGKEKWWDSCISGILQNEKYYGDVILQKTITIDFLTHKRVENKGQSHKYWIEGNYEPIVSKETFDAVKAERQKRAYNVGNIEGDRKKYSNKYPFSGKIICNDCGGNYKRREWNSTNKSKKFVWQCTTYVLKGKDECSAKAVGEEALKNSFVNVFNKVYQDKDGFIKILIENIEKVLLQKPSNMEIENLGKNIERLKTELKNLIRLQSSSGMDDEVYREEYRRVSNELEILREKRTAFNNDDILKESMKTRVNEIIGLIKGRTEALEEFDGEIFNALVEKIEIISQTHFVFEFKSGVRVEEKR